MRIGLLDLPVGTEVIVSDWEEVRTGHVAEYPEWAMMPHNRPLYPDKIPVNVDGHVALYAPNVVTLPGPAWKDYAITNRAATDDTVQERMLELMRNYEHIARRPIPVLTIAGEMYLIPYTARLHLDVLEAAGMVEPIDLPYKLRWKLTEKGRNTP